MPWKDRQGNILPKDDSQNRGLHFLYGNAFGRLILKVMIKPYVSRLAGKLMDSGFSRLFIKRFIKSNRIDMQDYEDRKYASFNDFFTRRVKPEKRDIDQNKDHLISPCDSKLSVYTVSDNARFLIKGTEYTAESLLRDEHLALKYRGGTVLIFRLTVDDYHRYCYPDSGEKSQNICIDGVYHTVNPIANSRYPIYKENTRQYCTLSSQNFGEMLIMEVGATMVGRIVNHHNAQYVLRGQEKGMFEFGGSTVIVFIQKDKAVIDLDITENTKNGFETVVKIGEKIGVREGIR